MSKRYESSDSYSSDEEEVKPVKRVRKAQEPVKKPDHKPPGGQMEPIKKPEPTVEAEVKPPPVVKEVKPRKVYERLQASKGQVAGYALT
jgi:hypothetical protein